VNKKLGGKKLTHISLSRKTVKPSLEKVVKHFLCKSIAFTVKIILNDNG
jgi:hypothetical protein